MDVRKTVGFVQVADTDRARAFYEGVLGLSLRDDGYALVAEFPGSLLRITTIPGYTPPEHPAFAFEVDDPSAVAAELSAKGVTFERHAFLGDAQGQDGIWTGPDGTRVGWFKDPDGNLLMISSHAAPKA